MVEYKGIIYERDARGKYRCKNNCHDPRWPAPSWTSDKGFLGHLEKCRGASAAAPPKHKKEPHQYLQDCPDCGSPMFEMQSCWNMHDRIVCIGCYRPYFDEGKGFHDCLGLELPDTALTI